MATGRIGVTPTLGTRWSKAPSAGTTSLSGLDDNSVSLVYSVGYEAVYRNGVLLSRTNDYTATDGTTVTLIDATIAGDIIEIFANQLVPLTDAISKGQFTAKAALLSATAASTPAVLTVGANDTVLTADSSTATGLKWATPAAGSLTLLSTTTLTGASVTVSSISGSYNNLYIEWEGVTQAADGTFDIQLNATNGSHHSNVFYSAATTGNNYNDNVIKLLNNQETLAANANNAGSLTVFDYSSATARKTFSYQSIFVRLTSSVSSVFGGGAFNSTSAISSLKFNNTTGTTFSTGTLRIYGVN